MNCKNTCGKLTYVKDTDIDQLTPPIFYADREEGGTGSPATPAAQDNSPKSMFDVNPNPLIPNAKYAFDSTNFPLPQTEKAPPVELPPAETPPPAEEVPPVPNNEKVGPAKNNRWRWLPWLGRAAVANPEAASGAAIGGLAVGVGAIGVKRTKGLADAYNPLTGKFRPTTPLLRQRLPSSLDAPPGKYMRGRIDLDKAQAEAEPQTQAEGQRTGDVPFTGIGPDTARTTQQKRKKNKRCIVGSYNEIKRICGPAGEGQAHHIVPDYTLRYGTRKEGIKGEKRIDGLPSFGDGPAICLQGNARVKGDAHFIAHKADERIAKLGGASGMAPIKQITKEGIKGAANAAPHCEKEIRNQIKRHPSLRSNIMGRTTTNPPGKWPPK